MTTQNTPTQREAIRSLVERQDRAKQTAFVGRIKAYDRDTQTATIEPQHVEVYAPTEAHLHRRLSDSVIRKNANGFSKPLDSLISD